MHELAALEGSAFVKRLLQGIDHEADMGRSATPVSRRLRRSSLYR
ncbi:hypothetical protein [Methylobacterium haplocladii]|nr:hypothetical protein [Methylobacterium haplocladii]